MRALDLDRLERVAKDALVGVREDLELVIDGVELAALTDEIQIAIRSRGGGYRYVDVDPELLCLADDAPLREVLHEAFGKVCSSRPRLDELRKATTISSFDSAMKDLHPRVGDRIKQWVIDSRREAHWDRETCPRVNMDPHDDNTGTLCSNVGEVLWRNLDHHCCHFCGEWYQRGRELRSVKAWLAEKAKRPPIEADRAKFSNQIEPERSELGLHPLLGLLKR